jgi:integrase
VPTVREFARRYLEEEAKAKLKPGSHRNYASYVSKHIVPAIGTMKLDHVKTRDIADLHGKIGKRSPIVANRGVECLGSIFKYGATCGLVPKGNNPAASVTPFREHARERFLSAVELARLGETLTLAETVGLPWKDSTSKHVPKRKQRTVIDARAAAGIRLLVLTGLRLREVLNLRWVDIDFQHGVALLSDSKVGRRYTVLNAPALRILNDLEQIGDFVIAGSERTRPRADLNRPWRAIRRHAGLDGVRTAPGITGWHAGTCASSGPRSSSA